MVKTSLLFLLVMSVLPLTVFAQEADVDADTAIFYLYVGKDKIKLSEVSTSYLRTAILYMGYKLWPIPYIKKVMEWADVSLGEKVGHENAVKMGQKLPNTVNIIYGSISKSGSTYTVSLTWLDGDGNVVKSGEKGGKGEYSISSSIDSLLGLTE